MRKLLVYHCHLRAPVLILVLSAVPLLGLSAWEARAQPEPAEIGKQVPGFEIEALRDSGRTVTPSDFEGRYVLLNLWATWCAPCIEKIPVAAQQVVVLSVCIPSRPAHQPPSLMIKETHECRECGSSNIVKNGHSASGSQQYHCKDCGAHKVLDPEPRGYSEEEKEKILRAYRERGSKRAISRIFGISRNTLNRWLEKRDESPNQ